MKKMGMIIFLGLHVSLGAMNRHDFFRPQTPDGARQKSRQEGDKSDKQEQYVRSGCFYIPVSVLQQSYITRHNAHDEPTDKDSREFLKKSE